MKLLQGTGGKLTAVQTAPLVFSLFNMKVPEKSCCSLTPRLRRDITPPT